MRAPLSWLREYVALPDDLDPRELAAAFVRAGLEVESIEQAGGDVTGPVVVGRVLTQQPEPQKNGKTINWCTVDVGPEHNVSLDDGTQGRGIVCGAHNFGPGDLVVVALPGSVLPGGFAISARKTYGHLSDGMICSTAELGLGDDGSHGIIVLGDTDDEGRPLSPGQEAADVLGLREVVLDVDITPDMPHCMSIRGLAREAAQAFGVAFTDPVALPTPAAKADGYPVRLEDERCSLFVAVSVRDLDPSRPTPRWLSRRLQQSGVRSISLPVDVTNYVMLETGQPLHGYDADRLDGAIVVRGGREGERVVTLDDVTRPVGPDTLLITDDSGPIGLAGVMGGVSTELSAETRHAVIEAASFDPVTISRTSRGANLTSEASRRFERGVDPNAAYSAAHRAADLLVALGGGTLDPAETVAGAVVPLPGLDLDAALPGRILGTDVPAERVVEILRAGGCEVTEDASTAEGSTDEGRHLHVVPPTWRPDLRDPYDYVEEVGQKIGLDVIEPVLPPAPPGRGLTRSQKARRAINQALAASGFVEALTLPFLSAGDLDQLGLAADDPRRATVRLANPLAETQPYLRTTLLPGLFAAVARNTSRSAEDLALWESGSVFRDRPRPGPAPRPAVTRRPSDAELAALDDALPLQPRHLAVVLAGAWRPASWEGAAQPAGWQQAIAAVEVIAHALGVRLTRRQAQLPPWHPGRCAEFTAGDVVIGHAGELHPNVVAAFGIPSRSCAAEIDLDALIAVAPEGGTIPPLSPYPVTKEDIALVVDRRVPVAEVEQAIIDGAGALLESVRLFDIYTGPQIGADQVSLAFALRFRALDRTLTDAEVAAARQAAVDCAAQRLGAALRS